MSIKPATFALLIGGGATVVALMPFGGLKSVVTGEVDAVAVDAAEHKLCDQAVDALLYSRDLVQLQRAEFIIREVNCAIGRRLPR